MVSVLATPTRPVSLIALARMLVTVSTTALATSPVPLTVEMIPLFADSNTDCCFMIALLSCRVGRSDLTRLKAGVGKILEEHERCHARHRAQAIAPRRFDDAAPHG